MAIGDPFSTALVCVAGLYTDLRPPVGEIWWVQHLHSGNGKWAAGDMHEIITRDDTASVNGWLRRATMGYPLTGDGDWLGDWQVSLTAMFHSSGIMLTNTFFLKIPNSSGSNNTIRYSGYRIA